MEMIGRNAEPVWQVIYSDGDAEEMSFQEMESYAIEATCAWANNERPPSFTKHNSFNLNMHSPILAKALYFDSTDRDDWRITERDRPRQPERLHLKPNKVASKRTRKLYVKSLLGFPKGNCPIFDHFKEPKIPDWSEQTPFHLPIRNTTNGGVVVVQVPTGSDSYINKTKYS